VHVIQLLQKCISARKLTYTDKLIIHSDRGTQFTSKEFEDFSQRQGFAHSLNDKPFNNQVSESLNNVIKRFIRLQIEPASSSYKFKPGSNKDPLYKLCKLSKNDIDNYIQFAIDMQNNSASRYNQSLTPYNFDNALFDSTRNKPEVLLANTNDVHNAQIVQTFRDEVTLDYIQTWSQFFKSFADKQNIEFEIAKRERAALYEQNRTLQATVSLQSLQLEKQNSLLQLQSAQIQELIEFQRNQINESNIKSLLKAKKANAIKQMPRDPINPAEFHQMLNSIEKNNLKYARIKVALVLLYITGLRVTNLLVFQVRHLKELIQKHNTTILINKNGGFKKIIIGKEAKKLFNLIQKAILTLTRDKNNEDFLFQNKYNQLMSREQFNKDINSVLQLYAKASGKLLKTHSFRISIITELLQHHTLQEVRHLIGHKDIRTTDVYNRNYMTERECFDALQQLAKRRTNLISKTIKKKKSK
jgi:site-specific recombinase XerD